MDDYEEIWALKLLDERNRELTEALSTIRRDIRIDAEIVASLEDELQSNRNRLKEVLSAYVANVDIDTYPEFDLLCFRIKEIRGRISYLHYNAAVVHSAIAVVSTITVNIARWIAGVELACMATVGSVFGGFVAKGQWNEYFEPRRSLTQSNLEQKEALLINLLRSRFDIRYSQSVIDHLGLDEFHRITDSITTYAAEDCDRE